MTSVLKTRRLKLRKFTQDDLDDLCRAPVPPSSVGRSRSRDRAANVRRIPPFQARPAPPSTRSGLTESIATKAETSSSSSDGTSGEAGHIRTEPTI